MVVMSFERGLGRSVGPHVEGTYVVSELQGTGRVDGLSCGWRV